MERMSDSEIRRVREAMAAAFKDLRSIHRFIARANFMCCGGCASSAFATQAEKSRKPYAVYWTRQDDANLRDGRTFYLGYGAHDRGDIGERTVFAGKLVTKYLTLHGIRWEWDGKAESRIGVLGMEPQPEPAKPKAAWEAMLDSVAGRLP